MFSARVLALCISFRLLNALVTGSSAFNPDEYWQSMEVAYAMVWSGGFIPWEFQSHAQIRGILHPSFFAALYWSLRQLGLDTAWSVANGPRLLQAVFAGVGDASLYALARRLIGDRGAKWTLFCALSNWFLFYCSTRTLSNSLECSLCMSAFYLWPDTSGLAYPSTSSSKASGPELQRYERRRTKALALAAIIFVIRPTNALIWVFLGLFHFVFSLPTWAARFRLVVREVLPIALVTLVASVSLDALFYNRRAILAATTSSDSDSLWSWSSLATLVSRMRFPLVSLEFLRLNSGSDLASLYGTHPWAWYLYEALPTILGPLTPPFFWALAQFARGRLIPLAATPHTTAPNSTSATSAPQAAQRSIWLLLGVLAWTLFSYSCNAHKELRFILAAVVPVAFILAGAWIASIEQSYNEPRTELSPQSLEDEATTTSSSSETIAATESTQGIRRRRIEVASVSTPASSTVTANAPVTAPAPRSRRALWALVCFLVVSNGAMASYFTLVHQSGPAGVFTTLRAAEASWRRTCDEHAATTAAVDGARTQEDCDQFAVHFLLNCHSMPLYSYMHVPQSDTAEPRRLQLHFLDCSPLFIDGSLHGNGSNPCSASAQFASEPLRFLREYYSPGLMSSSVPFSPSPSSSSSSSSSSASGRDCEWPWYHSAPYRQCLQNRLNLTIGQTQRINNELPGGGITPPPTTTRSLTPVRDFRPKVSNDPSPLLAATASTSSDRCAVSPRPLLPHVLVLASEKLEAVQPFLVEHRYQLLRSVFHSHLDDTKRYLIFQRTQTCT